ncbi:hypothetical protein AMJ85_09505 [candidate division BRC1 bacterium SM23_51]|nr:MAG: hypothetical protein AMJ85_09505 [candidate division BRC1 bacterium SM23_51]
MLHSFIVNPKAGRGRVRRLIATLEQAVRDQKLDYRLVVTERPGHATELARSAVAQGAGAVVAVGGDGTVNEVLNGLDGETALGIVPVGAGNDIARNIGLPVDDWRAVLRIIAAGQVVRADVGRCGDRRFLSVAGTGLDSRVAMTFNRLPVRLRYRSAYAAFVFTHLLTGRPSTFRLVVDGETIERDGWLVAVANTECYGGGMRVAPHARPDDGRLHVCLVSDGPRMEFARAFPLVYRGDHLSHPMVHSFEAKAIDLSSSRASPVTTDGEHIGWLPASITVEPQAVAIFSPQRSASPVSADG